MIARNFNVCGYSSGHPDEEIKSAEVKVVVDLARLCIDLSKIEKGLSASCNELEKAIVAVFRELKSKNECFKNILIGHMPGDQTVLTVEFFIKIVPTMEPFVDPIDIPGPDNPVNFAHCRS